MNTYDETALLHFATELIRYTIEHEIKNPEPITVTVDYTKNYIVTIKKVNDNSKQTKD
jgi:hypothetical protein